MTCDPTFELKEPFFGGDAVYGVPLANDLHFWIFGDTFTTKNRSTMIANSVAISECLSAEESEIDYFVTSTNTNGSSTKHGFFEIPNGDPLVRLWPKDAFLHDDQLHVVLVKVEQDGDSPMDFKLLGNVIATIVNIYDAPSAWRVFYRDVLPSRRPAQLLLAASILKDTTLDENYLYLYSLFEPTKNDDPNNKPLVVLRSPFVNWTVSASMLDRYSPYRRDDVIHYTYLAQDGAFKPIHPEARSDMATLLPSVINEFSFRYHPDESLFYFYYTDPILTRTISVRTSDSLTGPLSTPSHVYTFPEMDPEDPSYRNSTFCYATKEHMAFRSKGSSYITYCCNSFSFDDITTMLNLYVPVPVRLG